ncbi:MAG: hypothetical protein HUU50_02470 [Candidatus Brocadiae bacterium]|nr:hypothetical protein [Candidatus Brocadiia bacterium]
MKRYSLRCPKCDTKDEIFADLSAPTNLHCNSCDADIDIEDVEDFVSSWKEFIDDLREMEEKEEKDLQKEREN